MNAVHLHLVFNHFPIIGVVVGFVLLFVGTFWRNSLIRQIAFIVFVLSFLFGIASVVTGHSAHSVVENLPGVENNYVERHEDLGTILLWLLGILALFSAIIYFIEIRSKKNTLKLNIIALVWSLFVIYFATKVGTSGGEIRHPEIRSNWSKPIQMEEHHEHND